MSHVTVGPNQPLEPEKPRLPWLLVLALAVGGVALGYLLTADTGTAPSPFAEEESAPPPDTSADDRRGLLIPGYGGLLAVLLVSGSDSELAVWGPFATEPERMRLGSELAATLDLNSTRVWAGALSRSGASAFLHLGAVRQPVPLEPYADGITSFAWHLEEPETIAWTQTSDGRTALVHADATVVRNPTGATRPDADAREVGVVTEGTVVRAFGYGWYLVEGSEGLMTVDEKGGLLGSAPGWDLAAAAANGRLLLHRGDEFAWTDPDMASFSPAEFVPRGVAFSPDGESVAYLQRGADGTSLQIAPVGGPAEYSWELGASEQSRALAVPMDWTFDGFVLMPSEMMGRSYVMALNVFTGNLSEFGVDGRVARLWGFRGSGA